MLKKLKQRLVFLFFTSNTEFSELILGCISLFTGLWLVLPFCHWIFNSWNVKYNMPEVWGYSLILAGLFKVIGIFAEVSCIRVISALLASIVWMYLTASWYFGSSELHKLYLLTAPITLVLAIFNIIIYIKLRMVYADEC